MTWRVSECTDQWRRVTVVGTGTSHLDSSTQHPPRAQDVAPDCHTSGRVACLVIRFTSCLYNHFAGRGRKERGEETTVLRKRRMAIALAIVHGLPVFGDESLRFGFEKQTTLELENTPAHLTWTERVNHLSLVFRRRQKESAHRSPPSPATWRRSARERGRRWRKRAPRL